MIDYKTIFMFTRSNDDAEVFIRNHSLATGITMGSVQQNAIRNRYQRYKGVIANPNGSVLWNKMKAHNTRMWIHCPSNDTTASANAYNVEFFTKSILGTFNGFSVGDFTPNGVVGGTGRYFNTGISSNAYPLNAFGFSFYNRNSYSAAGNQFEAGASSSSFSNSIQLNTVGSMYWRVNESNPFTGIIGSPTNILGQVTLMRNPARGANECALFIKNSLIYQRTFNGAIGNLPIYFHGVNNNGVLTFPSSRQLSGYALGLPALTDNEILDMHWIENLYHTEIITGGRNV